MRQIGSQVPVNLALRRIARPDCFDPIFREGTKLIEEAAELAYDPASPIRASGNPFIGIAFMTAHGRLTKALINIGSWLVAHRALSQRTSDFDAIRADPGRPRLHPLSPIRQDDAAAIPPEFLDIMHRTGRLHARLAVIEASLYGGHPQSAAGRA